MAGTLFLKVGLQFARLEHFAHDVATAEEFALHIELRNGRPVGIVLDTLTDIGVGKHVDRLVIHTDVIQHLDNLAGEPTLREFRGALHEEHDVVGLDFVVDEIVDAAHFRIP